LKFFEFVFEVENHSKARVRREVKNCKKLSNSGS